MYLGTKVTETVRVREVTVPHDGFCDSLAYGVAPTNDEEKENRMDGQGKVRVVVLKDELIPVLVHELEDALKFAQEEYDLALDSGIHDGTVKAEMRIRHVRALQEAIGPAECPYCDDNHGRMDGRGCGGCNLIAMVDDDELRAIAAEVKASVPLGSPGCTCGTPPFASPEPAGDCPFHPV